MIKTEPKTPEIELTDNVGQTPTINLMRAHTSVREFKPDPVPQEIIEQILEAACWASTSCHLQPYTVIDCTELQDQIYKQACPQPWVAEAPVFLVFCGDMNRASRVCQNGNVEFQGGYVEQLIVASIDTGMFAQNTLLAAESMGLGGVFVGAIRDHIQIVSDLLQLPDLTVPLFGLCLGYPKKINATKPRLPLSITFKKNSYSEDERGGLVQYDADLAAYYALRNPEAVQRDWTVSTIARMGKEDRPHMLDFLKQKKLLLR